MDVHRIGGATVENLRLKPREAALPVPGISVIAAPTPAAAQEIRTGLPRATNLHQQAATVGTASEEAIRSVGFDVIAVPSRALPNHYHVVHRTGRPDSRTRTSPDWLRVSPTRRGIDHERATGQIRRAGSHGGGDRASQRRGKSFRGTIDLGSTPPQLRTLFAEFEEIVNGQTFVFLDEIQDRIDALTLKAVFDDGSEASVTDLQVFPRTGGISFRVVGEPSETGR